MSARAGERRRSPRFELHFSAFLRAFGEAWSSTETLDVSGAGTLFLTDRPFLLNTPVEYVITFPPELTKAAAPLRMRVYASVLRCERVATENGAFRVAVTNTAHRYLSEAEGASFRELEQELAVSSARTDAYVARFKGA